MSNDEKKTLTDGGKKRMGRPRESVVDAPRSSNGQFAPSDPGTGRTDVTVRSPGAKIQKSPKRKLGLVKKGHKGGPTPEIVDEICEHLRKGLPRCYAAPLAGVTERTLINWLNRGRSPDEPADSPYVALVAAVEATEGEIVAETSNIILQTMLNTEDERLKFDSARWLLEHRFARHFSKYTKQEISGPDGEAIKVENKGLENMSTDELLKIALTATNKNPEE